MADLTMNSIADVVAGAVPRSWHEAVAIVQGAGAQLTPGLSAPAAQDVLFDGDGTLTLGFGSESPDEPVVQLSRLLRLLLEGTDSPAPLMELAQENSRVPPAHSSINSFSRALAFFERPNRASDIAALAGRLDGRARVPLHDSGFEAMAEVNAVKEDAVDRNLEQLKDKIARTDTPAPKKEPGFAALVRTWGRPAAAAVLLTVIVLAAGAWFQSRGVSPATGLSNA